MVPTPTRVTDGMLRHVGPDLDHGAGDFVTVYLRYVAVRREFGVQSGLLLSSLRVGG